MKPHDRALADRQRVEDASRARALNAWRHLNVESAERAWRSGEVSLGELLPKVLEKVHLDQKLAESQLLLVCKQSIDPTNAVHAQPVGLVKGTLFVTVDSSAFLFGLVSLGWVFFRAASVHGALDVLAGIPRG